jgi:hypothetical protein
MTCVDFTDILRITLPYNRHHFDEVCIVTSVEDYKNVESIALQYKCSVHATDAFTRNGASFNKWLALEEGLTVFGRHGWLCIMDADILWPKGLKFAAYERGDPITIETYLTGTILRPGYLYSPLRRMHSDMSARYLNGVRIDPTPGYDPLGLPNVTCYPPESDWSKLPVHHNLNEWAGYTQIFHASDPVLGIPPWHETDWLHAGGADSMFQNKWDKPHKVRPPFEVLHLGPAGRNWFGRSTPYLDGSLPPNATENRRKSERMIAERRILRDKQFRNERIQERDV